MTQRMAMRLSGLAAMIGGVLQIPAAFVWNQPAWAWVSTLSWLLIIFGMFGIYAYQADESGLLGFLGFVLFTAAAIFLMQGGEFAGVDYFTIGVILAAVGLILLAIGTLAAGRFPRWVPWLWLASIVVGAPSVFGGSLGIVLGPVGGGALGLGLAGAGYRLWKSAE